MQQIVILGGGAAGKPNLPICGNGHRSIPDIFDDLAAYVPLPWSIGRSCAICAEQRPLVRLPAATRRNPTATFIKVFR